MFLYSISELHGIQKISFVSAMLLILYSNRNQKVEGESRTNCFFFFKTNKLRSGFVRKKL